MVTKSQSRRLKIYMNGIFVGVLEKATSGHLTFAYDMSWINLNGARPISLSLPLMGEKFSGDVVYNFFDNLLPDNNLMRTRIQTRFKAATSQPFDLLAAIGRDCIGAIQMTEEALPSVHDIRAKPLEEKEVAYILRNIQTYPLGMTERFEEFRISLAGAQEKTALLYWNNQWNEPLSTTPTTHIFKLPMGYIPHQHLDLRDSCENEWLCSQITESFGLPVAKCEIQKFEDVKVLIVERFDRKLSSDGHWIMRLPQEDMCQALGISPNLKYQSDGGPGIGDIMRLLLRSDDPTVDQEIFFQAQILFWLLAAIDGHAKNFSIHINANGAYRLTPLYDIISAFPMIAKKQLQTRKIKMAMALRGKHNHYHWYDLQRRYFIKTAESTHFSVQKAEDILNTMLGKVDSVIEQVSKRLPDNFPAEVYEPIFSGMQTAKRKIIT